MRETKPQVWLSDSSLSKPFCKPGSIADRRVGTPGHQTAMLRPPQLDPCVTDSAIALTALRDGRSHMQAVRPKNDGLTGRASGEASSARTIEAGIRPTRASLGP